MKRLQVVVRGRWWLGLMLWAASAAVHAQETHDALPASAFAPGNQVRIRYTAQPGLLLQGAVAAVDKTTLTLVEREKRIPMRIPIASITGAEMKVGEKRQWLRGALVGLGVGALAGVVLGATMPVDPACGAPGEPTLCITSSSDRAAAIAYGFAFGGALGGSAGAGIGALVKTETWVPLQGGKPRQALTAMPLGVRIGVRF